MPDAESRGFGWGAGPTPSAWMHERVEGHEWRVELREHRLAEWKREQGMTSIAIAIRLDGELLATVYPLQQGFGIDVVSEKLDFDSPMRVQGGMPPAVAFYMKGHDPFRHMGETQGGENGKGT